MSAATELFSSWITEAGLLQVLHFAWFMNHAREEWLRGVERAYAVTDVSERQYWIERFGLWFSSDFQIQVHTLPSDIIILFPAQLHTSEY